MELLHGKYEAASNSVEQVVAAIWAHLLEIDRIGPEDNFLLLGGESLLATQAASQLRDYFQCEVSVRSIFVKTVAEIAADIRETLSLSGAKKPSAHT